MNIVFSYYVRMSEVLIAVRLLSFTRTGIRSTYHISKVMGGSASDFDL